MYLALYRKYRPKTFDDVISQEHITTTLKNQVSGGFAGHAYLFTGSRGTGKTTCAKILAMAVNCEDPKDGNPCLVCERCREILDGSATDIVEMDAASNNGIDDVRQLRDEVAYTPVSCKFRVYIIDEVHMLSTQAFNALLKTLEEPPPHVKFILATTELHKVPATIVSRCQRFEFRRVAVEDSVKRLHFAAENEGVLLDDDAAELISRLSDGGMRDALSILDRCVSADKHITSEVVRSCAGVADKKHLFAFSDMIANGDAAGCIRLLSELYKNSKDVALVIDELSGHFRDLMLYKSAPEALDLLSALPDEYDEVRAAAERFTLSEILRCSALMQQCADGLGKTRQRKILAEMCLVKMCTGYSAGETAARSVSLKSEMKVKEIPTEDFVPTPPDKLSRENLINLSRTRALAEETVKIVGDNTSVFDGGAGENILPAEEVGENADAVKKNADEGKAVDEVDEKSEEKVVDEIGEKGEEKVVDEVGKADENNEEKAVEEGEKIEDEAVEEAFVTDENIPEKITEKEWQEAVSKLGGMFSGMLQDSRAEIENGKLVVYSSRNMLSQFERSPEFPLLEKDICEALGYNIKIVVQMTAPAEDPEASTEIEKLFDKAKQLGINIKQE